MNKLNYERHSAQAAQRAEQLLIYAAFEPGNISIMLERNFIALMPNHKHLILISFPFAAIDSVRLRVCAAVQGKSPPRPFWPHALLPA